MESLLGFDTYRTGLPPARSLKDIWPLALVLGATLFFADVFVRRVAVDFGWPIRKLAVLLGGRKASAADQARQESLERLRTSKSRVAVDIDKQRSATTFDLPEPSLTDPNRAASLQDSFGAADTTARAREPNKSTSQGIDPQEKDDYTARLLEAKRKAKKNNN
jgi:hypothetical protein